MKLYTASSWRNERYPDIVEELIYAGHRIYDFRASNHWFKWEQIDEKWESWNNEQFIKALDHPLSRRAFGSDHRGMEWADVCVLVLPCGKSAHIEAGYMKGKGKKLYILLGGETTRAELTYSIADGIFRSTPELLGVLR